MAARADRPGPRVAAAACCAAVLAAGCGTGLDTEYAAVRGPSINGVSTFVQMLRDAGHDTTATRTLPATDAGRRDVLVCFVEHFGALPDAAVERLEEHLATGPRTLVLVLRDDDAAIEYWRSLGRRQDLDATRRRRVEEQLAEAQRELDMLRSSAEPPPADDLGYTLESIDRPEAATPLPVEVSSAGGFSDETIEARWPLHRRLVPATRARVEWRSGADPLLVRVREGDDEILVVASATPLLNGGLVDGGNRRLAADLVARLPDGARVHVAGSTEVNIAAHDDDAEPSAWRLLAVSPHPWIAAQAVAALALFCWWRAPILGRPRRDTPRLTQDFGHHVAALGSLLVRARGDAFIAERIDEWRRRNAGGATRRGRRR